MRVPFLVGTSHSLGRDPGRHLRCPQGRILDTFHRQETRQVQFQVVSRQVRQLISLALTRCSPVQLLSLRAVRPSRSAPMSPRTREAMQHSTATVREPSPLTRRPQHHLQITTWSMPHPMPHKVDQRHAPLRSISASKCVGLDHCSRAAPHAPAELMLSQPDPDLLLRCFCYEFCVVLLPLVACGARALDNSRAAGQEPKVGPPAAESP